MSRARKAGSGTLRALDLIEEAVHLVRRAGVGPMVCYYAGGLPFILGLLYFWSDMSRGAFAAQRTVQAALTMAVLFVWMKCWQAVYAAELRGRLLGRQGGAWGLRRIMRLVAAQGALQPSGLFMRPLAALIVLPYGWVRAYYENVTALGDGASSGIRSVAGRAREQAKLWGIQNHIALSTLYGFGFFVWLNIALAIYFLPGLLKMLLGVETQFSRGGLGMLNSTFFFTSVAVAYLCIDPLVKAFYVVRCFYGESLRSGEDLRVRLRQAVVAAVVVVLSCIAMASPCFAEEGSRDSKWTHELAPDRLDHSIDQVLSRREYTWRMPPPANAEAEKGPLATFFADIAKSLIAPVEKFVEWMRSFDEWLRELLERLFPARDAPSGSATTWVRTLPWILYGAVGVAAVLGVILLVRRWRERRSRQDAVAEVMAATPDLASDQLSADELPEDAWLRLANEMTARGELRLALRAMYLAGLAHLGERKLLTLGRQKSDRDYERELNRRARLDTALLAAFGESLEAFERTWYGRHVVSPGALEEFRRTLERIRAC